MKTLLQLIRVITLRKKLVFTQIAIYLSINHTMHWKLDIKNTKLHYPRPVRPSMSKAHMVCWPSVRVARSNRGPLLFTELPVSSTLLGIHTLRDFCNCRTSGPSTCKNTVTHKLSRHLVSYSLLLSLHFFSVQIIIPTIQHNRNFTCPHINKLGNRRSSWGSVSMSMSMSTVDFYSASPRPPLMRYMQSVFSE